MAYVDHAFSISDEDMMMGGSHADNNRGPIKEIALAVALLVFGTLGIVVGIFMAMNKVGGDRAHGLFFAILGGVLFIPGFYYTRIAYYAYKGYKDISLEPRVYQKPEEAHFYFMPFSINVMRNHPRVHSASAIEDFVAGYTDRVRSEFRFWNASGGADHFYVYCHSVGRDAASKQQELHHNAIQVTCSSSYFQRLYIAHKDIGLPQVWPRQHEEALSPTNARCKLVSLWKNDISFDVFSGSSSFPYKEGFRRSRYCLHVKGYEVNTARVSDAIQHGCIRKDTRLEQVLDNC